MGPPGPTSENLPEVFGASERLLANQPFSKKRRPCQAWILVCAGQTRSPGPHTKFQMAAPYHIDFQQGNSLLHGTKNEYAAHIYLPEAMWAIKGWRTVCGAALSFWSRGPRKPEEPPGGTGRPQEAQEAPGGP